MLVDSASERNRSILCADARPVSKSGTIAGTLDIAGNFAAFILYDGYLGGGFEGVGNRELKFSVISKLLNNSMGCWLLIGCRFSQSL